LFLNKNRFSEIRISFFQDGNDFPPNQEKILTISNISTLDVTAQMSLSSPFYLICQETGNMVSELLINIKTGESLHLKIVFLTNFKKDAHNENVNGILTICYAEHQHNV
jgi:hypothetical protein